jgi:hypothetical protein
MPKTGGPGGQAAENLDRQFAWSRVCWLAYLMRAGMAASRSDKRFVANQPPVVQETPLADAHLHPACIVRLSRMISPIRLPCIRLARKSPGHGGRQYHQADSQVGAAYTRQFSQPRPIGLGPVPEKLVNGITQNSGCESTREQTCPFCGMRRPETQSRQAYAYFEKSGFGGEHTESNHRLI